MADTETPPARAPAKRRKPAKVRARNQRPDNWREQTGHSEGRPPRIFDLVKVQRPVQGSNPVRFQEVEVTVTVAICDFLRIGIPILGSCESVGVPTGTYHQWRAKGFEDIQHGRASVYREFHDLSTRAIAESQVALVVVQRGHANRDPRANEFLLRTRFPKDFGERHRLEVAMAEDDIPDEIAAGMIREAALRLDDVIDVPGVSAQERRALAADTKKHRAGNGRNGNGAR